MDVEVEIRSEDGGLLGLVPDSWPPGPVRIAAVLPDSQAAQHQLRVGDELRCINGLSVASLERRELLALELAKRPLTLQIHRPDSSSVIIDVQVAADAGALGFFPKHWPPGPVVVGAVLPKKIADEHGVKEGDLLWLVGGAQASLMSPAELTKSLAKRPQQLRFVRGDSSKVAMEISKKSNLLASGEKAEGTSHEGDLFQQLNDLQVQQLHLQQLQHRKEQETQLNLPHGKDDWLSLLERQKDEKYAMQSMQREHLSQLGESLQQHQDLLGALDRDEGTGYGSGLPPLPPLKIRAAPGAAVRKPPKPAPPARRSREEAEKMEQQEEPEKIVTEEKMEEEPGLQEQDEEEKEVIEQIEQREQEEDKSEEIAEQKPEGKQIPEELQADKPKLCQELSVDQTTQTETAPGPQDDQPFGSSYIATEFSGLKPLSALEPQMSQFDLPKTRQRQVQVPATTTQALPGLPGLVEHRRLRELPPPERPPGEMMADTFRSDTDCNSLIVPPQSRHTEASLDINELQSWLARSSLSADAVIF